MNVRFILSTTIGLLCIGTIVTLGSLVSVAYNGSLASSDVSETWHRVSTKKDQGHTVIVRQGKVAPKKRIRPLFPALDHQDITEHQKIILNELIYTAMPDECRKVLTTIRVLYQDARYRGLAGTHTVILDGTLLDDEFRAVAMHELGHIIDIGCFTGGSAAPSTYMDGNNIVYNDDVSVSYYNISWLNDIKKRPDSKPSDFFSGYSRTNPFEDFAEHFAAYMLQRDLFARLASRNSTLQNKYNWMDRHFGHQPTVANGKHIWNTQPWDVTVLPYEWIGEENIVVAKG